jgi:putative ABC transport system permease protein
MKSFDRWTHIVPLRLRSLFRRDDVERELDDELQYHVEQQTAENIRQGMTSAAARTAALRALGGVEFRKEQVRDTRGTRWLEELSGDLAFSFRSLRHARGFATTVVLTLALGIGANTAMFTLLRGTLLRGLPNSDGQRLVYLRQSAQGQQQENIQFSVPEVADYRASTKTLATLAEYSAMPLTFMGDDGKPSRARVGIISGNYFQVMGLEPALGRLMGAAHDGPAAAPVSVLTYQFWMDKFGGDSSIVGRTVRINDKVSTVLGVVEHAPHYPQRTDVFVNIVTSPHHLSATMVTGRTHRMTELFARLTPNSTVDQAREEISGIATNIFRDHPETYDTASQYAVTLLPLREAVNERASRTFWLLMGAAAFVLLIACANVANLTLMRGVGREREMLVRAALGAGRARLRRLLIAENLTLALLGGSLGVLVAFAGLRMLVAFAAQFSPRASEIRVDGVVLAVGLITSVIAAIALAFVPRIGGERGLATPLSSSGHRLTLGRGRQRFQQSLVIAQLAVCMVLLTGAGLLVRTLSNLSSVETGVRATNVLTLELPIDGPLEAIFTQRAQHLERYERMRERVRALPGVETVALGSQTPLRALGLVMDVKIDGRPVAPNQMTPRAAFNAVDPDYFAAAGIPLVSGRAFQSTDRVGSPRVVLLNESLARQLFGDRNPVGERVAWTGELLKFTPFSDDWRTVVGVVGDTRDRGLDSDPSPTMFLPFAQEVTIGGDLMVRTTADPAALQPAIVRAVREINPRQLIERVQTLEQIRDETVAPRRLNAMFITSFGTLALLIAMVGIAGVLAFSVSSRTAEIGIRMSFGADAGRVHRMILGEGGVLLAAGLAVGVTGALLAARLLRGFLFGVTPNDPATIGGVALILAAVGLAACWLPAARAARVDPAVALRAE